MTSVDNRSPTPKEIEMIEEEDDTKYTKLFVGGIPYHTKDETLQEYFLQFDKIKEAVIIREKRSRRSKGYGFVTMATEEGAKRACENKKPVIDGREANVDLAYLGAKPKSPRPSLSDDNDTNSPSAHAPESPSSCDSTQVSEDQTDIISTSRPAAKGKKFQKPRKKSSSLNYVCDSESLVVIPTFDVIQNHAPCGVQLLDSAGTQHSGVPWYSSPNIAPTMQPLFHDQTVACLVTIPPQAPVAVPVQQTVFSTPSGFPVYDQPTQTKVMPSPGYVYAVPTPGWYVGQAGAPIRTAGYNHVNDPSQLSMYNRGSVYTAFNGPINNPYYAFPTCY